MSIKLVKAGAGAVMIPNSGTEAVGEVKVINTVNCIQGIDDKSGKARRNAYYPNETTVFQATKALATDLSTDDDEIFYDSASGLATAGPASGTVFKVGRKMPGDVADVGGTTSDEFVQFIHGTR